MGYRERKRAEMRNRLSADLREMADEERARADVQRSERRALVASIADDLGLVPFRVVARVSRGVVADPTTLPDEDAYGHPVDLGHHNSLVASIIDAQVAQARKSWPTDAPPEGSKPEPRRAKHRPTYPEALAAVRARREAQ